MNVASKSDRPEGGPDAEPSSGGPATTPEHAAKPDHGRDHTQYLRTDFLDRVAHELRGPAGVTLGALDELELALGAAAEEHKALFAMARRGVRKVLRTAERLTRTAQLESGHVAFAPSSTDVRALLERAASDAELLEGRRGVKVELSMPQEECLAELDAGWAQAAIAEVVAHALRAARREVKIGLEQRDGLVRIAISDDGTGGSKPPQRRFEPRSDRRDAGLSLPLAHEIARAHGGDLVFEPDGPSGPRAIVTFGAAG